LLGLFVQREAGRCQLHRVHIGRLLEVIGQVVQHLFQGSSLGQDGLFPGLRVHDEHGRFQQLVLRIQRREGWVRHDEEGVAEQVAVDQLKYIAELQQRQFGETAI